MAHDIMSQFYTCLNLPFQEKLMELTRLIDQTGPNKDLQALFPQLINNIFAPLHNGWGLRQITFEANRYEFEALLSFLEPQGPMFRLCYKLLYDPQLKYNLPLNTLPLDLQMTLERGRCPQFYADMLTMDSNSMNIVALALNPFDYYIFNFALYLINNNQNKSSWDNWNSVYFALACDYLMHFLPSDPNVSVLPHIPHYTGKVPMAAPLQTANRPLCSPSLLVLPDLSGISNQHVNSPQTQSRNEVWRSETVLQIFIDLWMSVEPFNNRSIEMYQRTYHNMSSSPERVRIVRVLVKHIHSFSAKYNSDPAIRSSTLRKYARQIMCSRAYHYVKHLVMTWPLDASFRLVMELWLSLIQPWRYTDNSITQDRFPSTQRNQDETNTSLDASFTQFIAENFPSYTCILQMILPRFTRLDLSSYKNAVMLFRVGKVFSQQHLVPILMNLEKAITDSVSGLQSPDNSGVNLDQSYTYNGVALSKWVAIAKQSISELNMAATFEYDPIWSENKNIFMLEFVKRILSAKHTADKNLENYSNKLNQQNQGFWSSLKQWLMMGNTEEEAALLEEYKKVPNYLTSCIHYFTNIFGVSENMLLPLETELLDNSIEHSSFANSTNNFTLSIAQKLRNTPTGVQYMGDPDLMPIMSFENTILVRMLYQIASRLNDMYGEEFSMLWRRNDFWGYVSREILQKPVTIHTYVKDASYHQNIINQELPPRLSLRRLGSHKFVVWISLGYILFRLFSYSGIMYVFFLIMLWSFFVLCRASLKILRIIKD
ncbi:sphingomyelin phosphodiesterase 4 [Vanessa tameamea]|uniref:Sphingomyelin phosphodiesterase 4 n=1 Tax=Vanessa tameamea TaxID=334116 RepID=A0A8B8ICV7_VANTA